MHRSADRMLAAAGLLLFALPMLVIALCVAVSMGRPVLFRQARAGLGGGRFELLKFRSMTDRRDASGALLPDADRVTPLGRLLRRSRLDELPELWNILRGDMAFVGPRPLLPDSISDLGATGALRCSVRPGLTGLAQISGNSLLDMREKVAIDLLYVRERSAVLDVSIMLRTPLMMVAGERIDRSLLEKAHAGSGGGFG